MKLATFLAGRSSAERIGVAWGHDGVDYLIDARAAYARVLAEVEAEPEADAIAAAQLPSEMTRFLARGAAALTAARRGLAHVREQVTDAHALQALLAEGVLHPLAQVTLKAPVPRPGKIISVGANYKAHVSEGRATGVLDRLPAYPPAFLKMPSSVIGSGAPVHYPAFGEELDYEVELAIVIGTACSDVAARDWLAVVAGFTMVNDLSLRDVILQEKDTGIILCGKNFPTACPMGPYLVTPDEIGTPDDLALRLRVNGELRQDDRTSSMVHDCGAIVAHWSRLGLEPGDVITTGTPGGGAGFHRRHPERLLKVGDVVEAEVQGIGVLRNRIERAPDPAYLRSTRKSAQR